VQIIIDYIVTISVLYKQPILLTYVLTLTKAIRNFKQHSRKYFAVFKAQSIYWEIKSAAETAVGLCQRERVM